MKKYITIALLFFALFSHGSEKSLKEKPSFFKIDDNRMIFSTYPFSGNLKLTNLIYPIQINLIDSYIKNIFDDSINKYAINFDLITIDKIEKIYFKMEVESNSKRKVDIFYSFLPKRVNTPLRDKHGEFYGKRVQLWNTDLWPYLINEFKQGKRDFMVSAYSPMSWYSDKTYTKEEILEIGLKDGRFLVIDSNYMSQVMSEKERTSQKPYFDSSNIRKWTDRKKKHIETLLLQSSQPITADTDIKTALAPILLIDEKDHKNRADSEDWRIYTYMNGNNGDFFQYFFFETELDYEWPLYIREFAMDHLAGAHICKKSTVLVNNKSHEKVFKRGYMRGNNYKDVYIPKTKGKQWRPAPIPKDKNTIPIERLLWYWEPGRIFGSYAKVWELDVWQMLPNMLRDNPEGVYLIGYGTLLHLNECKTPYEEQALLKKCGVLITPQIYKELQSLCRLEQSQSPDTKK